MSRQRKDLHREGKGPAGRTDGRNVVSIIQGPAIKGKIDDAGGDTDNDKKEDKKHAKNLFIHGKTFPSKFHESDECYITLLLYHRLENKKTDKELSLEILCIGKCSLA